MKIRRLTALLLLTTILLPSCSAPGSVETGKAVEKTSVIIGAFIGLSGDVLAYGDSQKKGIELAKAEINESSYLGDSKELKIIMADAGANGESAKAAVTRLIHEDKAVGLIGPTLSSQALIADPVAQAAGIPVIAISNTAPGITEIGNYIFRCSLPESEVIAGSIKTAASQLWIKNVAYLWGNDEDYMIAGYKAFTSAVDKYGLRVVCDQTFSRGDTDFSSQLKEIIKASPDAILASALAKEAVLIIVQARELGYRGTIIGGNGFNSQNVINQAGTSAEGVLVGTAWNSAGTNPKNHEFISNYQKAYDTKPDQFAAQAYTATWLFANAIRNSEKADPASIREALSHIINFTTPLGAFSFTDNREPVHPSIVQIIRNGHFVTY